MMKKLMLFFAAFFVLTSFAGMAVLADEAPADIIICDTSDAGEWGQNNFPDPSAQIYVNATKPQGSTAKATSLIAELPMQDIQLWLGNSWPSGIEKVNPSELGFSEGKTGLSFWLYISDLEAAKTTWFAYEINTDANRVMLTDRSGNVNLAGLSEGWNHIVTKLEGEAFTGGVDGLRILYGAGTSSFTMAIHDVRIVETETFGVVATEKANDLGERYYEVDETNAVTISDTNDISDWVQENIGTPNFEIYNAVPAGSTNPEAETVMGLIPAEGTGFFYLGSNQGFEAVDAGSVENAALSVWVYIGNLEAVKAGYCRFEITSGANPDIQACQVVISDGAGYLMPGLVQGWNRIIARFSGQPINPGAINYFRFFTSGCRLDGLEYFMLGLHDLRIVSTTAPTMVLETEEISLERQYSLRLRVTAGGTAVEDAQISFSRTDDGSPVTNFRLAKEADGTLVYSRLTGQLTLTVSKPGYASFVRNDIDRFTTTGTDVLEVPLAEKMAVVTILNGETPVANTEVEYTLDGEPVSGRTNANGEIRIGGLTAERTVVITKVGTFDQISGGNFTVSDSEGGLNKTVTVSRTTYTGKVTVTGAEDVTVTFAWDGQTVTGTKQADGTYTVDGLYGEVTVTAEKEGYTIEGGTLTPESSSLTLTAARNTFTATVTVTGAEDVTVTFAWDGQTVIGTKQADGTYTADGLYGEVTVTAEKEGYSVTSGTVTASNPRLTLTATAEGSGCFGQAGNIGSFGLLFVIAAAVLLRKRHSA